MKHDGLDRLTGTVMESKTQRLLAGEQPNGAPVSNGDGPRQDNWNLDLVGNWTTRTSTEDLTGGGVFTVDGKFDSRNAMTGFDAWDVVPPAAPVPGQSGHVRMNYRQDLAGNTVFDGQYWYQYDAWNRLAGVNVAVENVNILRRGCDAGAGCPRHPRWEYAVRFEGAGGLGGQRAASVGPPGKSWSGEADRGVFFGNTG